jgi:tetratricopeptide (TPR) repeat protein
VAKKIVEKNPERAGAHFRVGEFYARLGRHREAIEAYQEAIKLGDKTPDAQAWLADSYARSGERDKALAILQRLNPERNIARL